MSREEILKQIELECERIEEDCKITAKSQYNAASTLRGWHWALGIIATVSSVVAGYSAIESVEGGTALTVACSFISALITAILATLKPLDRASTHHQFGVDFQKLRDDTRIFRTVKLLRRDIDEQQFTNELQKLSDRRTKLRSEAPQHSYKSFLKANKGVQDGQATYEADKK